MGGGSTVPTPSYPSMNTGSSLAAGYPSIGGGTTSVSSGYPGLGGSSNTSGQIGGFPSLNTGSSGVGGYPTFGQAKPAANPYAMPSSTGGYPGLNGPT